MKQVFTLEIDSSDYVDPVTENDLSNMLTQGFYSARMGNLSIRSVKETTVEQTCGTPENVSEKAFDLLKQASDYFKGLAPHCEAEILESIEEYIRDNTREQTE